MRVGRLNTDNNWSSPARHTLTAFCRRQFDHIIGNLLFSVQSSTVWRSEDVKFVVRLGDVVRGVTTTVQFGDGSAPVDNVTLTVDDDLSSHYRYHAVVSHRYSCTGRYQPQLTVYAPHYLLTYLLDHSQCF